MESICEPGVTTYEAAELVAGTAFTLSNRGPSLTD